MSEPFVAGIGAVLSADIAVPEHEREVRFYARVLGTGERPLWRDDLMSNVGVPVIGLGKRTPEFADLPLVWMPHIQVADVAASAQRAAELGGRVLMEGRDAHGATAWAVVQDANGAVFGLVPVVPNEALPRLETSGSPGAAGRIAWLDLTVPDAAATRDFYREVVGWTVEDVAMEDGGERYADFTMVRDDGVPGAGVCHARGGNADLPPVWLIYLPVGDLDESLQRVEVEGGTIVKAVRRDDGRHVYAVVRDPVGASLALVPG